MNINHATAKIRVSHLSARPNFFMGPTAITFHLTRGHFVEGDTETFNDAINFIGTVQAMYAGKSALVKKGVLPAMQPTRFQRVQVMEATLSSQWRIGLPNGVSVLLFWQKHIP